MNCRLWSLAGRTFVIAAVCACALDASYALGQDKNSGELEDSTSAVASKTVKNRKVSAREERVLTSEDASEDLTKVEADELQVAPSPKKKSSTSLSREQKRRSTSKRVRKLNVPATLGSIKSTRKSETELDKIFASRSKLASEYIQYGPSANVASSESYNVGAYEQDVHFHATATGSRNFVTNAPYVEQSGVIQQTVALSPESIEPTVPKRYPVFEEDALTQESVPLTDELDASASENAPSPLERPESSRQNTEVKDDASTSSGIQDPFVQDVPKTPDVVGGNTIENVPAPTIMKEGRNESSKFFTSPWGVGSRTVCNVVQTPISFENQFSRYSGIFADFEWLGWQSDSCKQSYAVATGGNNRVYDELSLTPSGIGYRGRLGLRTIYGWDLTTAYTTFDADKGANVDNSLGTLYTSSGKAVDEIKADADVELNICDVEVGRWITRERWAARPFAGVRWARLNQTQNVDSWNNVVDTKRNVEELCLASFDDAQTVPTTAENTVVSDLESVFARSKSDMYGVRLGAEGSLALFQNLSVYGRGAATIAVGDASFLTDANSVQDGTSAVKRSEKSFATPAFETALGLTWRRGGLEVKGGYELNVLTNASYLNGKSSDFVARGFFVGIAWNN